MYTGLVLLGIWKYIQLKNEYLSLVLLMSTTDCIPAFIRHWRKNVNAMRQYIIDFKKYDSFRREEFSPSLGYP
jgi:hypothetical protein